MPRRNLMRPEKYGIACKPGGATARRRTHLPIGGLSPYFKNGPPIFESKPSVIGGPAGSQSGQGKPTAPPSAKRGEILSVVPESRRKAGTASFPPHALGFPVPRSPGRSTNHRPRRSNLRTSYSSPLPRTFQGRPIPFQFSLKTAGPPFLRPPLAIPVGPRTENPKRGKAYSSRKLKAGPDHYLTAPFKPRARNLVGIQAIVENLEGDSASDFPALHLPRGAEGTSGVFPT